MVVLLGRWSFHLRIVVFLFGVVYTLVGGVWGCGFAGVVRRGGVWLKCICSLLMGTFAPSFCVGTFVMLLLFFLSSRRFSSSNARGRSLFWGCVGVHAAFVIEKVVPVCGGYLACLCCGEGALLLVWG